jgi:simple sugar transport system ATP-binding protein
MHNAVMKRYGDSEFSDGFTLNYQAMEEYADTLVKEFDVRGISDVREINAGELSGGNLQKLILAREMLREPDLLVANQPTRGVDVGAIEFIRERLVEQRKSGTGVLLLSEDLDELFDLSDRILVIYQGEIVYETTPEEADRQRISLEMNGGKEEVKQPAQIAADGGRSNLS